MKCKFCGHSDSKVIDSRTSEDNMVVRRRRECPKCGKRFTTIEEYETTPILVIKRDGTRQTFDKEKLKRGIIKACEKRPVSIDQINQIVTEIEKDVYADGAQEISSIKIGEMVMEKLKALDEISYIRFACVYRRFEDVSNLIKFLENIKK